jgi:hypothetical protein
VAAINREYEHKQNLIQQAKAEYAKKNLPPSSKTASNDSTLDSFSQLTPLRMLGKGNYFLWSFDFEEWERAAGLNWRVLTVCEQL